MIVLCGRLWGEEAARQLQHERWRWWWGGNMDSVEKNEEMGNPGNLFPGQQRSGKIQASWTFYSPHCTSPLARHCRHL